MKTLDRYIFFQLIGPFLFGFFLFVVLISIDPLMMALQNVINDNVSAWVVGRWFLCRLPQDMIFTFPMSILLGTLIVFGRMSKDSETIALKAGGINFFRILLPVLAFAITIIFISFLFNELVVPFSNRRANEIRRSEILRLVEPEATENAIMKSADGSFVYARKVFEVQGKMEKVLLEYYSKRKLVKRVSAAQAKWENNIWVLEGVVEQIYPNNQVSISRTLPFYPLTGLVETPSDFAKRSKRSNEMSYSELKNLIEIYDRTKFVDTVSLKVDLALKTSLPFASFFFAIIGASFGLTSYRSGAFISFGVAIVIIFVYYVIMSITVAMGKSGYLPVMLSAWLQNIIFGVSAIFFVSRINQ